jgi:UDP-glucose 4-epimerase
LIKNKKIFITGGAGFIGSVIASRLLNHNVVVIYDNFDRTSKTFFDIKGHNNLKVVNGDLMNIELLNNSIKGANFVIHCAAIAGIDSVIKSPTNTMRVNAVGTYNLLEASKGTIETLEKVITFSTSEVFGSSAYKVNEESSIEIGSVGEARWTYAVSKLAGEHMAMAYFKEFKMPITIVRPFNIYGPGQVGVGAMNKFIKNAINDEPIEIYGDGSQIRAWCYLDDFLEALFLIFDSPMVIGESLNIGNARQVITTYGLAAAIIRTLNSKSRIIFKDQLSADIELRIPELSKIKSLLNFEAKYSMEEGIRLTAEYIKNENPTL